MIVFVSTILVILVLPEQLVIYLQLNGARDTGNEGQITYEITRLFELLVKSHAM